MTHTASMSDDDATCVQSSLDSAERVYRSGLSGMRICQLYAYLLLFELMLIPIGLAGQYVGWLIGIVAAWFADQPTSPLALSWHGYGRSFEELFYIANVTLVFFIYASFTRAWWVLLLCLLGLAHNVYVTYVGTIAGDTGLVSATGDPALASEQAAMGYLFFAGIAATHVWFFWVAVRGQRDAHTLESHEALLIAEPGFASRPWATTLATMFNVPGAIRYSRRPWWTACLQVFGGLSNFANYWIVTMGFLAVSASPMLFALFAAPAAATARHVRSQGVDANAVVAFGALALGIVFIAGVFISIPVIVAWLGRSAIRLARRTMRRSLHEIQGDDTRAPILFLRSFLDDQVSLAPRRFMPEQWLLDGASRSMTLDYMLLGEGTAIGPTVALGNPDDPAPPYGVARGYFEHSDWQQAVAGLCERSAAIVMVLDGTEGVAWEIAHIVQSRYLPKTLFLLAPGDVHTERGDALLARVLETAGQAGMRPVARDSQLPLGLFLRGDGRAELLTTAEPTVYTYLIALRYFLRGRLERQGPAQRTCL